MPLFFKTKTEDYLPGLSVLTGVFISLILYFQLDFFIIPVYAALSIIVLKGIYQPWIILLTAIPILFAIPPASSSLGQNEICLLVLFSLFVIITYAQAIINKKDMTYVWIGTLFSTTLFLLSFWESRCRGISVTDWARGLAPFLFLYLMFPIAIVLENEFKFKLKWVFIAFSFLTMLLVIYINVVFFAEHFYGIYWINKIDGTPVYQLSDKIHANELLGPFRDRITLRIQQATSELLPLGFAAFTVIACMVKKRYIFILSMIMAELSLFAIMETYTRSMLVSALSILFAWFVFKGRKEFIKNCRILLILGLSCLIFTTMTNLNSIWFGRMQIFFAGINELNKDQPLSTYNDKPIVSYNEKLMKNAKNSDQNMVSRIEEYQIAWSIFLEHPLFGGGIGVKHNMSFPTSEGHYIHQKVGYVHNWFFYWLMVGGIGGLMIYGFVLIAPLFFFKKLGTEHELIKSILIMTILIMCLYSSFFAVFRLITFNLLLSFFAGISLCLLKNSSYKKTEENSHERTIMV